MKLHHWCLFASGALFIEVLDARSVFILALNIFAMAFNLWAYFKEERKSTTKQHNPND